MTVIKFTTIKVVNKCFGYLFIPTWLKKRASCLLTPNNVKLKMQIKVISNIRPVISSTSTDFYEIPKATLPSCPRVVQIWLRMRRRTEITCRILARLMAFRILIVFSSWARSWTCTRSNRNNRPIIVGKAIEVQKSIKTLTLWWT